MKELRSIIIIPVPDVEDVVADLRNKYDPAALEGLPAHITVIFPFYSPVELTDEKLIKLKSIFKEQLPIHFFLSSIDTFPNVVFLKPDPSAPFIELTNKVTSIFPDKLPYGGIHESIKPHLTMAQVAGEQSFESIKNEIDLNISDKLPLLTTVDEAWLMIEDENENWSIKDKMHFGKVE